MIFPSKSLTYGRVGKFRCMARKPHHLLPGNTDVPPPGRRKHFFDRHVMAAGDISQDPAESSNADTDDPVQILSVCRNMVRLVECYRFTNDGNLRRYSRPDDRPRHHHSAPLQPRKVLVVWQRLDKAHGLTSFCRFSKLLTM